MELISNDTISLFIMTEENKSILEEYKKLNEEKSLSFYEKSIKLKNLRAKIYDNSINVYENTFEKNKSNIFMTYNVNWIRKEELIKDCGRYEKKESNI